MRNKKEPNVLINFKGVTSMEDHIKPREKRVWKSSKKKGKNNVNR